MLRFDTLPLVHLFFSFVLLYVLVICYNVHVYEIKENAKLFLREI